MERRKKVLVLIDWFYPAYRAGGPIQSVVNLTRTLGNELSLKVLCGSRDLDGTPLPVKQGLWTELPDVGASVFYNPGDRGAILRLLRSEKGSVAFINGIYSIPYNFLPALLYRGRKIISVRGMLHPGALSQKSGKKKIYLWLWKLLRIAERCEFHVTTPEERAFTENVFGKRSRIWTIPNLPRTMPFQKQEKKDGAALRLCTVALISPMKNHLLVLEALSEVAHPVIWDIYGPVKDNAYWDECLRRIKELPGHIQVNYHGEIPPAQVGEALGRCHVYIQPSKSENFGHSLLEALFAGRPMITSTATPWNALADHKAGINADCGAPGALAGAISFFCGMDGKSYDAWCASAHAYAHSKINIAELKRQYLEMFLHER